MFRKSEIVKRHDCAGLTAARIADYNKEPNPLTTNKRDLTKRNKARDKSISD